MLVTYPTCQSFISSVPAGPQSAPKEQQPAPDGTNDKQLSTAAFSCVLEVNALGGGGEGFGGGGLLRGGGGGGLGYGGGAGGGFGSTM